MKQVEPAQLAHVLKSTPIAANLIWFLKIFAGNTELELKIEFARVQMWFAVI